MPNVGAFVRAVDFPAAVEVTETTTIADISSTSYSAGSVQCSTTFTANSAGKALIQLWTRMQGDGTFRVFVGIELREGSVSGTIVRSPSDTEAVQGITAATTSYAIPILVSGLTAGATYFVRTMHKVAGGTTSDIFTRKILVTPQP